MAKKQKKKSAIKSAIINLSVLALFVVAVDLSYYFFFVNVNKLAKQNPTKTAFMRFREERAKAQNKKYKIKQTWVSYRNISPFVKRAVIISEDAKFWNHEGFDFDAIEKAIEKNLQKRKFKVGASTITQQLAKNLYLSPKKTPLRKIHEAILTWRIERTLSKKRILELYLNVAEWGNGIFGIEAASRAYFKKSAKNLNAYEACLLASVLPNPIRYSPIRPSRSVTRKSNLIRRLMVKNGYILTELESSPKEKSADSATVAATLIHVPILDTIKNDTTSADQDSTNLH